MSCVDPGRSVPVTLFDADALFVVVSYSEGLTASSSSANVCSCCFGSTALLVSYSAISYSFVMPFICNFLNLASFSINIILFLISVYLFFNSSCSINFLFFSNLSLFYSNYFLFNSSSSDNSG